MPAIPPPLLARVLFPDAQPHLQRRYLRQLGLAIVIGLLVAAAVAAAILHSNAAR